MKSGILSTIILSLFGSLLYGQEWQLAANLSATGNETCQVLVPAANGGYFLSGSFNTSLNLSGTTYSSHGEDDILLARFDSNDQLLWARQCGSLLDDRMAAMTQLENGHLLGVGEYWVSIDLGDFTLNSSLNSKAIFFAEWDTNGEVLWARSIYGAGIKIVEDLETDALGNQYLCGYFGNSLQIEDTTLIANGDTDFFVLKFSPSGELLWATNAGQSGDTRANSLIIREDQSLVVGGFYSDTTIIANDTLTAFSFDHDVFLAGISETGQLQWGRKLGGVYDDELIELLQDGEGNYYQVGHLTGVMKIEEGWSIQSTSIRPDVYLIKFDEEGVAQWATTFGSAQLTECTDAYYADSRIIISGVFQEVITLEGFQLTATQSGVEGFIGSFDLNGNAELLRHIGGTGTVLTSQVILDGNQNILAAGTFDDILLVLPDQPIEATAGFDAFVLRYSDSLLPVQKAEAQEEKVVFPNPNDGLLYLPDGCHSWEATLYNDQGQLMLSQKAGKSLQLSALSAGRYHLVLKGCNKQLTQTVIMVGK